MMPPLQTPALADERIRLRPLNPGDYRALFVWHSDMRNLHLWWADRRILDYETFLDDLRSRLHGRIHTLFVIEAPGARPDEAALMGMVYVYDMNAADGFAYLCIYLVPDFVGRGIGPSAGRLFGHYLFATFGLRKLYCEIFDYNHSSLNIAQHAGFVEEGCLRSHRWFLDRYWDLHILAITREQFYVRQTIPKE